MTTDLKALAEAFGEGGCCEYCDKISLEVAAILHTLADADKSMPVVAERAMLSDGTWGVSPLPGLLKYLDEIEPLVRQSDAQAAILAATERAEKAENDGRREPFQQYRGENTAKADGA